MRHDINQKDPRFKIAMKETWFGVGLVIFNFIWWYGFAYGLGSRPISEYSYVFGLPAWFFYSCVLGFIVMLILVVIVIKFWFKDIPFEEDTEGEKLT